LDHLLPPAARPRRDRLPRLALPPRRRAGALQFRLVVRLLPARLRAPRAGHDDLPSGPQGLRPVAGLNGGVSSYARHMNALTTTDAPLLARAIELAQRGVGPVTPNPNVGAVGACGGGEVGAGWRGAYCGPHDGVNRPP